MTRADLKISVISAANGCDEELGIDRVIGFPSRRSPENGNKGHRNLSQTDRPNGELTEGHGWFYSKQGVRLRKRWWLPYNPKAAVAIIHGYAEHCNRYAHVAETLAFQGYAVYSYDQRAHGESDGQHTYIESFHDFVDDMELFLKHLDGEIKEMPLFILAHSMGGLVALHSLATNEHEVAGLVLTGPAVAVSEDIPNWLINLSQPIGQWFPELPTVRVRYQTISHDTGIMAAHDADPLIYRGRIPARTAAELNRAIQDVDSCFENITAPIYIAHGSADRVVPSWASQHLYEKVGSSDKTLQVYDNLYHEILNETCRDAVKTDILTWMEEHLPH